MILLSVDPGVVNIGYCVSMVDPEYQFMEYGVFNCSGEGANYTEKLDDETNRCLVFFTELFDRWSFTHVAWELPPSFGGMGQQTRILSNVTALKVLTWQREVYFDCFTPIAMKKKFTGDSKAEKSAIRDEVIKRWPSFDDSEKPKKEQLAPDVFDAIGIGVTAVTRNEWKRFERESAIQL